MSSPYPSTPDTTARPSVPIDARRARLAVTIIFWINGASMSAIMPRYPEIVAALGLDKTMFGLAVGIGPIGGLIAGIAAARLMRRFGSGPLSVFTQILASASILLIVLAPAWWMLTASFFIASACDAVTDIAMNAHGMRVQRRYGRSVINSFHGWWSVGAVCGGLIGAGLAQVGIPLSIQAGCSLVVFAAIALWARTMILPGADNTERTANSPVPDTAAELSDPNKPTSTSRGLRRIIPTLSLHTLGVFIVLGTTAVFAGATEDAGNTWGALYMQGQFQAAPLVAGLAFVALQGAQTVGRLTGDALVDRIGDRGMARIGAVVSAGGMSLALLVPSVPTTIIGFACAGWGVATLFPAVFHAADERSDLAPGVGITFVGWVTRVGFLVSPPLVGAIADRLTLRYALWLVPIYAVGVFMTSGVLAPRQQRKVPVGS
ncbi:MFS transporter [Devriesea agamarum]|uniref:MFS transporter n=1 Tax=Devriesea agamarum TaxID=472569 RepID=UPI00071E0184|nr:MFS transporter [Devriesea agamarum]